MILDVLEEIGGYVCQTKVDGVRAVVTKHGLFSRTGKPLVVPAEVQEGVDELLSFYPTGEVVLEGELLSPHYRGTDVGLYLFDVVVCEDQWLGGTLDDGVWRDVVPYEERWDMIFTGTSQWVTTPMQVGTGFRSYFQQQEALGAEGVVCKRLDGGLIGSARESAINPTWCKLRYADCPGGVR